MSGARCRWGIIGTAQIARKNWQAIHNAENATLVAVASRSQERSRQYIADCQSDCAFDPPPVPCGSYADLLARDDIDAVYIPLPTGLRKEWVIQAARAGKHVVCEKPCGSSLEDLQEMLETCQSNNVQFMDGVMFMHSQRMSALREVLDDAVSIGEMKRITSQFSFRAPDEFLQHNIRVNSELEPHGCLGDLGWYNIRFTLWAMNWQLPQQVTGRLLTQLGRGDSPTPVPVEFSGEMVFKGGVSAGFYCSFLTEHQQWANISGSRGYLRLQDFVLPFYGCEAAFEVSNSVFNVQGCQFNMEDHVRRVAVNEYSNNACNSQETNLFRNFSGIVLQERQPPIGTRRL